MIVVIGSECYAEPAQHLDKVTSEIKYLADNPKDVSLVIFTGGEDVHPSFYEGVDKRGWCMTNIGRDRSEKKVFQFCIKHNIKMTGICRGIQFLNVMANGFMYQHISRHAGMSHEVYFPYDKSIRRVTSTHHQLVGLSNESIPIAWSHPKRSDIYIGPYGDKIKSPEREIEAAIFPSANAMGVQYHPEMMSDGNPSRIHYSQIIADFMEMNMEIFINKYDGGIVNDRARGVGEARRE